MEMFEQIRRGDAAGKSIRELAKEFGIHRRMVRRALASPNFSISTCSTARASARERKGRPLFPQPGTSTRAIRAIAHPAPTALDCSH